MGTSVDHLFAAKSLIHDLLGRPNRRLPISLKAFLVECYTYVGSLSILSTDRTAAKQSYITPEVVRAVEELIEAEYIGNLTGCWLGLLLIIPRIFDFGHLFAIDIAEHGRPSIDLMMEFAKLHTEIIQWRPYPSAQPDVRLAGYIYRQAVLMYLYTSVADLDEQSDSSSLDSKMKSCVDEGLSLLSELSPTGRINTSLCWPTTVLGSCLDDPEQQDFVRQRLELCRRTFGFENITLCLSILELTWSIPLCERGPWKVCTVMTSNDLCITFA